MMRHQEKMTKLERNRYILDKNSNAMKRSALSFSGVPALDYGARLYSAGIGRWLSQDPLGEEYYWLSPYSYCAGNPVDFVDPT